MHFPHPLHFSSSILTIFLNIFASNDGGNLRNLCSRKILPCFLVDCIKEFPEDAIVTAANAILKEAISCDERPFDRLKYLKKRYEGGGLAKRETSPWAADGFDKAH